MQLRLYSLRTKGRKEKSITCNRCIQIVESSLSHTYVHTIHRISVRDQHEKKINKKHFNNPDEAVLSSCITMGGLMTYNNNYNKYLKKKRNSIIIIVISYSNISILFGSVIHFFHILQHMKLSRFIKHLSSFFVVVVSNVIGIGLKEPINK